jgi:uncharacterized protein (TIGR03435 family)
LRIVQAAEIAGIRAIMVHAISEEAKRFYEKYGFVASPVDPMTVMVGVDRFWIAVNREMKIMPAYEMMVAKGGLKMLPFDPAHPPVSPHNHGGAAIMGVGTMAELAKMVPAPAGRPVLDKTGLEGRYSYVLSFMPLSASAAESESDSAPPRFVRRGAACRRA